MRKALLVGIISFLVVITAVLSVGWFVQSAHVKSSIEQHIAQISKEPMQMTHDGIEVSGFPTHMIVTFTNPRFSGRMDTALQGEQTPGTPPMQPMPEWNMDAKLTGTISVSVNALSDHYVFTTAGEWVISNNVAGKPMDMVISRMSGENQCSLSLARSTLFSNFWSYDFTAGDAADSIAEIREVDCNLPASQYVRQSDSASLLTNGPARFYFKNQASGAQANIRLHVKMADMEVTSEGDKVLASYITALAPTNSFPALFSVYGKQNLAFDLSYSGSTDMTKTELQNMDINLTEFNLSNDVYSSKGTFHLANNVSDNNRTALVNTRFESSYTEAYDMLVKEAVRNFIHSAATSKTPEFPQLSAILQTRSPDDVFRVVEPAIPQLSPLGTQIIALDATYAGAPGFTSGNYNLKNITISMTPYGITGYGTVAATAESLIPKTDATLTCTNCMQLIGDLLGYAGRVVGVIQSFSAEAPPVFISPALIEGVKGFFDAISSSTPEDKKKGHYLYTISTKPDGNILISGRPIADIMTIYNDRIGQVLDAPANSLPPAGWQVK